MGARHVSAGLEGLEVRAERVGRSFGAGARALSVVEDCTFTLRPGELTAMIGPSGCGKSTLAFLIAGYDRPSTGRVLAGGRPVEGPSTERLLLFQESALMPWLTTFENVLFGPRARRENLQQARERARELLERVGLESFSGRYPAELSGGMQRRAELARALINDPAVMVLDEPFRGLDALTRELMQEYCAGLLADGRRTTLLVTTDLDEALLLADRVLVMTNRPARVRAEVEVDLPRPRTHAGLLDDPRAQALRVHLFELLRAEALRSFARTTITTGGSRG
jgi:NitT/TauT family transport system ATP-binding protein